jgi:hypothetical protein
MGKANAERVFPTKVRHLLNIIEILEAAAIPNNDATPTASAAMSATATEPTFGDTEKVAEKAMAAPPAERIQG